MPTTVGIVGFIPLNSMRNERIEPIGLVNKSVFVDGIWMEPIKVAFHDLEHVDINDGTDKHFYDEWKKRRNSVSVERGQNVELAYHLVTHESFVDIMSVLSGSKQSTTFNVVQEGVKTSINDEIIRLISRIQDKRELREIIDLSGNPPSVADDFIQVFNKIQGEMRKQK